MRKHQKEAIRARARNALENLYHNATPTYPDFRNDFEADQFWNWFSEHGRHEIDYIEHGGAYAKASNKGLKFSAILERTKHRWEFISQYGKLYQWGRGGRTLAPMDLIQQRGGSSFSIRYSIVEEWNIADLIELIQIVESFNSYVAAWCKCVPEEWKWQRKESGLNRVIWRYDGKTRRNFVRYA